jgi:hypothetical protein
MTTKSTGFWVATPCSSERVQCFRGTWHFHLQGKRVSQAWFAACFYSFLCLDYFKPWRWRWYVQQKCWALSRLHGTTTKKAIIFIPFKSQYSVHYSLCLCCFLRFPAFSLPTSISLYCALNLLLYPEDGEGTSEILATIYKIMLYHNPKKK